MVKVSKVRHSKATNNTVKKSGGVIDRIQQGVEFDDSGIKMLLYGRSGTGKTSLWATFPKPILAMICSGSTGQGELRSLTKDQRKEVHPVTIEHSGEIPELVDYAKGKYPTIVLDHGSGLQDLAVKEYLGLDELPLAYYKVAGTGESWGLVSQQGWGQIAVQMKQHFRFILGFEGDVVIIAQERDFGDSESEFILPSVGAALTPSVTGWLNPACDYIANAFIRPRMVTKTIKKGGKSLTTTKLATTGDKSEFCIRIAPDPVYMTKFRMSGRGGIPDVLINPTYEKLLEIISKNG